MDRRSLMPLFAAVFAASASTLSAQTHVYNLDNSLADMFAGPSLVANGGTLDANGYMFGLNQGLSLSNVFSATSSYSIVLYSTFTLPESYNGFKKMVDFKDQTTDNGIYRTPAAEAQFHPFSPGSTVYTNGVFATTIFTRDVGTDVFSLYVDGVLQATNVDAGGIGLFTGTNNIAHFFEDDFTAAHGEGGNGRVDYIATYDRVLSAGEVANYSFVTSTPEPATLAMFATGLVGIAATARRRRRA